MRILHLIALLGLTAAHASTRHLSTARTSTRHLSTAHASTHHLSTARASTQQPPTAHPKIWQYAAHTATRKNSYIVEFEPSADHASALASLHATAYQVTANYTTLFTGAAVHAPEDHDLTHIASLPGVRRIWPTRIHTLTTRRSAAQPMAAAHSQTGVARVRSELGADGGGSTVCFVDSGVDYKHAELGACWKSAGCAWQLGTDFVGDAYDPAESAAEPDDDPMDCAGHGTHVAGIARGVAPGARLGMYRVFGCEGGSTADDVLVAAIERAYADGCDVINLSLGAAGFEDSPVALACADVVRRGAVVVAAAGNEGSDGMFTAAAPAVAHGAISVGSVDGWSMAVPVYGVRARDARFNVSGVVFDERLPFEFDAGTPLVAVGCVPPETLRGALAVVADECVWADTVRAIEDAGALGALVRSSVIGSNATAARPLLVLDDEAAERVAEAAEAGDASLDASYMEVVPVETGGQPSEFSALGPAPGLAAGVHVVAPGRDIYSTFPTAKGGHAVMSGTSMAAPYVAGVVALLRQVRPSESSSELRRTLVSSAAPVEQDGVRASPLKVGTGLVDVYAAARLRARASVVAIGARNGTLHVANHGASAMTVRVAHRPAPALSSWLLNGTYTAPPRTSHGAPEVHVRHKDAPVGPGKDLAIAVSTDAPPGLGAHWVFGGFLEIAASWADGECQTLTVPYTGLTGDQIDTLSTDAYPRIANGSRTCSPHDPLTVQFRVDVPSRDVLVLLVTAGGKKVAVLARSEVPKSTPSSGKPHYEITFNGTVNGQSVADGEYAVHISALRFGAEPWVPANYQMWKSPSFVYSK